MAEHAPHCACARSYFSLWDEIFDSAAQGETALSNVIDWIMNTDVEVNWISLNNIRNSIMYQFEHYAEEYNEVNKIRIRVSKRKNRLFIKIYFKDKDKINDKLIGSILKYYEDKYNGVIVKCYYNNITSKARIYTTNNIYMNKDIYTNSTIFISK